VPLPVPTSFPRLSRRRDRARAGAGSVSSTPRARHRTVHRTGRCHAGTIRVGRSVHLHGRHLGRRGTRQGSPMTRTQQVIKRAIDVGVSGSALFVLLPLLPFVALFIKLESPGPVFYVARRYGQNRRPFDFYKLRTMVPDADRLGSLILTKAGDERVTRVGRILRPCKIDVLPQLLNVLKGDMSIVGPRPEVFEVVENHYRDQWERILSVRPGLTCLLQVAVYPEFTIGHAGVADPIRYYIEQDLPLKI